MLIVSYEPDKAHLGRRFCGHRECGAFRVGGGDGRPYCDRDVAEALKRTGDKPALLRNPADVLDAAGRDDAHGSLRAVAQAIRGPASAGSAKHSRPISASTSRPPSQPPTSRHGTNGSSSAQPHRPPGTTPPPGTGAGPNPQRSFAS